MKTYEKTSKQHENELVCLSSVKPECENVQGFMAMQTWRKFRPFRTKKELRKKVVKVTQGHVASLKSQPEYEKSSSRFPT